MIEAGRAALFAILDKTELAPLRRRQRKEDTEGAVAGLLEKQREHANTGDTVAEADVLVVVGNAAFQTLGLFQLAVLDEVRNLSVHSAALSWWERKSVH